MSELVYQLRNVTKVYEGRTVLDVGSLDVVRGEVLCLVGPSGAGKSTLLRLLNFLEHPTEGTIQYGDTRVDEVGAVPLSVRREVTTVFQRPVLLNRSVRDNVAFGLQLRGRRDHGRKVAQALRQVGLAGLATRRARTLSGGELQRVALARALVLEPKVLLLDEPTANLDPYNVATIEDAIRETNGRQHTTTVLVTHNVFQARRLAHRVGLVLGGSLIEVSGVEQFFEHPVDPRTGAFVRGDMVY